MRYAPCSHPTVVKASPDDPTPLRSTLARPALADLVRDFAYALPELAAAIADRTCALDLERARSLAHRLKGSAAGYGYPDIRDAAAAIEASAAARDHEATAAAIAPLRALCARARRAVEDVAA